MSNKDKTDKQKVAVEKEMEDAAWSIDGEELTTKAVKHMSEIVRCSKLRIAVRTALADKPESEADDLKRALLPMISHELADGVAKAMPAAAAERFQSVLQASCTKEAACILESFCHDLWDRSSASATASDEPPLKKQVRFSLD